MARESKLHLGENICLISSAMSVNFLVRAACTAGGMELFSKKLIVPSYEAKSAAPSKPARRKRTAMDRRDRMIGRSLL